MTIRTANHVRHLGPAPAPPTGGYPTQCQSCAPNQRASSRPCAWQHHFRVDQLVAVLRVEMAKFGHDAAAPIEDVQNHPPSKESPMSTVGYNISSLSSTSIKPGDGQGADPPQPRMTCRSSRSPSAISPLYSQDYDADYPPEGRGLKEAEIAAADAILFVTPEYNRSIPGRIEECDRLGFPAIRTKNLDHVPAAFMGLRKIGTALGHRACVQC